MPDNTQGQQDAFDAILTNDIDALFSRELTSEEVDVAVMGEIGATMAEATAILEYSAEAEEDNAAALRDVVAADNVLSDLGKRMEIKARLTQREQ